MRQVWYHRDCVDGFGAAWALNTLLPGSAVRVALAYGDAVPKYASEDEIYIVDFSFNVDVLRKLRSEVRTLFVIDHHASAQSDVSSVGGTFDASKSGAVLTWEEFAKGAPVPKLLQYVQDRDLWKFVLPASRTIQWWVRSLPFEMAAWDEAHALMDMQFRLVLDRASAAEQLVKRLIEQMIRNARMMELAGLWVPVVNTSLLTSDVCDAILARNEDIGAAYYFDDHKGVRRWGARSRAGYDDSDGVALRIAQHYGGGGHPNAAGWVERL